MEESSDRDRPKPIVEAADFHSRSIARRAYARVGLLGNPSDGYNGKTLSFSLANFFAEVTLQSSRAVAIKPCAGDFVAEFASLRDLAEQSKEQRPEHADGGVCLLVSLCACLHDYCQLHGIDLPPHAAFTLSYSTNIPRQVGLSGSSAIIAAALSCLLHHFHLHHSIPVAVRPNLILEAESRLGIAAGLQDRVIQTYGGLVFMDFNRAHLDAHGYGIYEPMDPALLPPLHVIFAANPSDSGQVHSSVRQRWRDGDVAVRQAMADVAALVEEGRDALVAQDWGKLARLMDRNFDLRRQMFGDEVLGEVNLAMVQTARAVGAAAKFTGSGGAVVAFCPEGEQQRARLVEAWRETGFCVVDAQVAAAEELE
ncbi:hypothetical protein CLOM_g19377 [Closterium sp. NIES-68]|nr:hypothetical protein CLOM_g19377 [Closterium sp. NIES-68]GJP76876.1 hypothetical protein CLOP_g7326 [Closterium sp. NIES-67]